MAASDREVFFANEAFAIGMLQAVSGGALIAALAQSDAIADLGGELALVSFLSLSALALLAAILAAYWRHQYKLWDVKGGVSAAKGSEEKAVRRGVRASAFFRLVRVALLVSVLSIGAALTLLIASFWYGYFNAPLDIPADCPSDTPARGVPI